MFHSNRGGMTPMTVRGAPSSTSVRPITPGSAPNERSPTSRWPITATGGAPGAVSDASNARPSSGATPRKSNPFGVIHAIVKRSAPASLGQCIASAAGADDVLERLACC